MRARCILFVTCLLSFGLSARAPLAVAQADVPLEFAWGLPASAGGGGDGFFDCDVNTGVDELVLTILPAIDLAEVTTLEARLYLRAPQIGQPGPSPPLADYWQLEPGGCRANAFSMSTDFSGEPFASLPGFEDVVSGRTALATFTWPYEGDPSSAVMTIGIPLPAPITLLAGHRYHLCRVRFSHVRSTGTGACPGCCETIGIGADAAVSQTGGAWSWTPGRFVGPGVFRLPHDAALCRLTPASASTWGSLKTRYR